MHANALNTSRHIETTKQNTLAIRTIIIIGNGENVECESKTIDMKLSNIRKFSLEYYHIEADYTTTTSKMCNCVRYV